MTWAKILHRGLDRASTTGEVAIAFRQGPQAVHVLGKDDPAIDAERCAGAHLPNRVAIVDLRLLRR
jgi:hypothetical protein